MRRDKGCDKSGGRGDEAVDQHGEVVYWWSWTKMQAGVQAEDGVLPNGRRAEDNPDGNTHDVWSEATNSTQS